MRLSHRGVTAKSEVVMMARAGKPSLGSSTQQGMNVSSGDMNTAGQQGQNSQRDANKQANKTVKQGSGKNK